MWSRHTWAVIKPLSARRPLSSLSDCSRKQVLWAPRRYEPGLEPDATGSLGRNFCPIRQGSACARTGLCIPFRTGLFQILPQPFVVRPELAIVVSQPTIVLRQPPVCSLQLEHQFHAGQVQPFVQERADSSQGRKVSFAVAAGAAVGPFRGEQPFALVLPNVLLTGTYEFR